MFTLLLSLLELWYIDRSQGFFQEISVDKWMETNLFYWNSIILIHLKTLEKEKSTFDRKRLVQRNLIPSIIDLGNQVFHFIRMEWCFTDHHLIQHNSKSPSIDFCTVTSLFKELRRTIKWSTTNTQLGVCSVKNSRETKIRYFDLELHSC